MTITAILTKDIYTNLLEIPANEAFDNTDVYHSDNQGIFIEVLISYDDKKLLIPNENIEKIIENDKYTSIKIDLSDSNLNYPINNATIKIITQVNIWDFNTSMIGESNYDFVTTYREILRRIVGTIDMNNPPTKTPFNDDILLGAIGYDNENNKTRFYTTNGWIDLNQFIQTGAESYSKTEANTLFAFKNGDENQNFAVKNPINNTDAVNLQTLQQQLATQAQTTVGLINDAKDEIENEIKEDLNRPVFKIGVNTKNSDDSSGVIDTLSNVDNDFISITDGTNIIFKKAGTYIITQSLLMKANEMDNIININTMKNNNNVRRLFFTNLNSSNWKQKQLTYIDYFDVNDEVRFEWSDGKIRIWGDDRYSNLQIIRIGGTFT